MKKLLVIFLLLSGFSCNPYKPYLFTHYHITARYNPSTTSLSANVQMVFVADQEYHDSLTFKLNESVEILSLTAQELKYYEFDKGSLVLHIQEVIMKGDQIHISLTYQGFIGDDTEKGNFLTPDKLWYPQNRGIDKLTYSIKLDLPEHFSLEEPWIRKGQSWHWSIKEPMAAIALPQGTE
jgi:hypothetical protein